MSVEGLQQTAGGGQVLACFDVPGGKAKSGAEAGEAGMAVDGENQDFAGNGEPQHMGYFDVELNNYADMPIFERRNVVSHTFDIFGEDVLPFLSNDYAMLTL
uniref:Uncharacterized protein n=1 Tax=Chloropicon laureae TaxID=464258 RepID=A0A7S3E3C8_9CHLO